MSKEQAKASIQKLVDRFAEHYNAYHTGDYNEAKTRQDFINPFFKALGWDVDNENGMSEAYREVIYEDKVVVRGKAKAPDYGFRLMGQGKKRLFYVEAKKPSVALKANKDAAYQLRRYGSSAQAPISILTNFEDFIVYDCSKVPNLNDSASVSRLKHIHFEDYIKEFDFIYDTFSHEAVTKGRFDKFVQSDANKKGSQTLDKEFVQSLDTWRKYLATSIAVNNKKINDEELNFCVQLIIDRLIFLRFCEDRSVEPYGQLQGAASKGNAYGNLFELFEQADAKYNSGLFDFEKDKLTSTLKIDNKVVKNIVEDLYFPQCRYEFSVMPVEVLGNAYEQFLGKVIRILPSRGVKIEEKPEVRKAGGVFYTPQYIVDYIVKSTVGKLIDGKTPKEIDKVKIVDPACGSGSFLVGAFEYLLNYHTDWYHHNLSEKEKKKGDILSPDGKLTTHEKKRILINNIYGVDIDANAVEVSKLSLLLKCMEGETEASIKQQVTMFHERVLPDLDNNVKDGNTLVDTDFYDNQFDLGFDKKVKPFNWKKGFPTIFQQGGFDIVIGNPPYVTLQLGKKQESQEKSILEYYQSHFPHSYEYKINLYALFMERSLSLIKDHGLFSFIVPNTFYNTISFKPIRKFMLDTGGIETIMDLRYKVFIDAEIGGSAIFVFKKDKQHTISNFVSISDFGSFQTATNTTITKKDLLADQDYNFVQSQGVNKIFQKIQKLDNIVELGSLTKIYQGIITGDNKKFLSEKQSSSKWKPILKGRDINRYSTSFNNTYVYYSPADLWSNTDEKMFKVPAKIISRQTSDKLIATIDTKQYFSLDSTHVIHPIAGKIDIRYLLGLYNSRLINFLYQGRVQEGGRVFAQVKTVNIKPLPIKLVDSKSKTQSQKHGEIIGLVDSLLKLNEDLQSAMLPAKIEQIKQRIDHHEERINKLVYELYELTDEEIKIVEGGSNE
ncbi:MAG: Eco57I restriction-modification methylase domain-containing protein [Sphingobacteriaceae bacterium]